MPRTFYHKGFENIATAIRKIPANVPADIDKRLMAINKRFKKNEGKHDSHTNQINGMRTQLKTMKAKLKKFGRLLNQIDLWIIHGTVENGIKDPKPDVVISVYDLDDQKWIQKQFKNITGKTAEFNMDIFVGSVDFLGIAQTDKNGKFRIAYRTQDFHDPLEFYEKHPDQIFLSIQEPGNKPICILVEQDIMRRETELIIQNNAKSDVKVMDGNRTELKTRLYRE